MKILIHSSISLCTPSRAILYDEAEIYAREGHEVFFLYCGELMDICLTNPTSDRAGCIICRKNYLKEQKTLSKKIHFLSLKKYSEGKNLQSNFPDFDYFTIDDIKKIKYKGSSIGLSALSTYISITRNLSPLIDSDFKIYFNQLLYSSIKLIDVLEIIIEEINPGRVLLYNGRLSDSRPVWEFAQLKGIDFFAFEGIIGDKRMYKSVFHNTISHMIDARAEMLDKFWNDRTVSLKEKEFFGNLFFEKRRNSQIAGDKVYTQNQKIGCLPSTWDDNVRNIIIFTSSEDEFAAVWDDLSLYKTFESQLEGIRYIANKFGGRKEFNFYIRIHPNLVSITYKYHTDLYQFASIDNFYVIDASSPISSYTLLDSAEKIITFGSTIGIESVYWNKPVILLGPSDYYYLGACYLPTDNASVEKLIEDRLEPKDKLLALKYGYFLLNEHWPSYKYIDFSTVVVLFNLGLYRRKVIIDNWLKFLGSRRLYKIFDFIWTRYFKMFYAHERFKIPLRES